jgi:hypothetical protein
MWSSAFDHFGEILAPEQPPALVPVQQPHFNASACIQLLGVLPQSEGELRASALARLRTFMAEDQGTVQPLPTVPRASHRRRRPRTPTPPDSASESDSSESSNSESGSSESGSANV